MSSPAETLISTGGLAARLGVSVSLIKKLEREGIIVPGIVIEGSGRKVWRGEQLPAIQSQFDARRRRLQAA
ncbi:MAG: hypothetical protein M3R02_19005 [Chloroflexota bacterium]|nr:hypothetical protein [Chloroflexota bacterium]